MATPTTDAPTNRLQHYLNFIKIEHTLFALPIIVVGALIGFDTIGATALSTDALATWGLIVLAATGARTAAMSLNRIIDQRIDAHNPRTAGRELPAGRLRTAEAWALVVTSFALLFWAAWALNPLCLYLAPVLVVLFTAYPYAKRWTWTAHFWLGAAWACGPAGGYLAVTGTFEGSLAVAVLSLAAFLWVAGFDIIYALLDVDFDRQHGLRSAPARWGASSALGLSKGMHLVFVVALAGFGWLAGLGWGYWIAWLVVAGLLHYEHQQARKLDAGSLNKAFFNVNAALGWVVLAGVLGGLFV